MSQHIMAREKFRMTAVMWQFLFRYAASAKVPAALGDETFDIGVQSNANDQIMFLRRDLRAYSPILQKHGKLCFGPEDNWKKTDGGFDMVDSDLELVVTLCQDAICGIFWCLLMMAHPRSPIGATMAEIDEFVWVIAEKFGFPDELRKYIRLDRSKAKNLTRKTSPSVDQDQTADAAAG